MNKEKAISKIQLALKCEPQVITPKGRDYDDYVKQLSQDLLDCVISPVEVKVVSTCAVNGDFEKYQSSTVWAIAKQGNSWLLTLEDEDDFALGFGDNPNQIMMHGFSSSDVLAEWCA